MAKPDITRCTVCGKPILSNNDCFDMGTDGLRHRKCGPGSSAWKEKYGEPKGPAKLFDKAKKPARVPAAKDPIRQAIKEFCGRIKYLQFMDTVNKLHIDWSIGANINGHPIDFTCGDEPLDLEKLYEELSK